MTETMERPGTARVHPPRTPAPWPVAFYRSSVGKKWVMAITGIVIMGFVFGHMIGNFKVYLGVDEYNHYGEFLRELLVPLLPRTVFLWLIRSALIVAFVFHIHSAYGLTRVNQRARGGGYEQERDYKAADLAGQSMRYTGIVLGLFILFHLADLTWGTLNPDFVRGDVYRNLVASLQRPPVAALYFIANLALGLHLWHGAWSLFQSMGVNNPRWNGLRRAFAIGFAAVVTLGNLSFPMAVGMGIVDEGDCITQGNKIVSCGHPNQEATR
jgi:succinate dehydrogenase / fumarate reductase cytochrome b subunit